MRTAQRTCIVIPNWNGLAHLTYSLPKFVCSCGRDVAIILVDDGSNDDSLRFVIESFPAIVVLRHRENRGFAAAVNTGLKYAASRGYKYVAICNSDIYVPDGFLRPVVEYLEGSVLTAVVGYQQIANTIRAAPDLPAVLKVAEVGEVLPGMLYVCRLAALEAVGLYDESYFMYGEENDLFRRLLAAGFKIVQTNIAVWHHVGGSRRLGARIAWYSYRNGIRSAVKAGALTDVAKQVIMCLYLAVSLRPQPPAQWPFLRQSSRQQPSTEVGEIFCIQAARYNTGSRLRNLGLALSSIVWNLVFLGQTLGARSADARRIRECREALKSSQGLYP